MHVLSAIKSLFRYQTTGFQAFHRFSFVFLALGVAMLLTVSCSGSDDNDIKSVVRAERLEIVDGNGIPRVVLHILDGGRPSIVLRDNQGVVLSWLFLSDDGSPNLVMVDKPRLALMDQNNGIRASQHLDPDGQPVISLRDAAGQVRSELRLGVDGSSSIRLFGDKGEVLWTPLPVESKQAP